MEDLLQAGSILSAFTWSNSHDPTNSPTRGLLPLSPSLENRHKEVSLSVMIQLVTDTVQHYPLAVCLIQSEPIILSLPENHPEGPQLL